MLLARMLRKVIRTGWLRLVDAFGNVHDLRGTDTPRVVVRLHDRSLHHRLVLDINLAVGEAYMDGTLTIEEGNIYDLLDLYGRNTAARGGESLGIWAGRTANWVSRHLHQRNDAACARRNASHHYDLPRTLYSLFLDADCQYSCAYFRNPDSSLEQAQEDKKRHIAAKLLLDRPGLRVLDIGSGWGGLGLHLAKAGAEVTGLTLSDEQHEVSQQRAALAGLAGRAQFHLRDYRAESGRYDRIVSVGMFEHVGVRHYRTFFAKFAAMLEEDGVAVLHAIGRAAGPGRTNSWTRKYIFPGGYCPALSEVLPAIERANLLVTDIEILHLHYAATLREWRRRFLANSAIAHGQFGPSFCRMWEFYLAASEVSFRRWGMMVFQIQMAKRNDRLPPTRDYLYAREVEAELVGLRA